MIASTSPVPRGLLGDSDITETQGTRYSVQGAKKNVPGQGTKKNTAVSTSVHDLQICHPEKQGSNRDGPDRPSNENMHTTHAARELSRHGG